MLHWPTDEYVFPTEIRICFLVGGILGVSGLLLFSGFMFYVACMQEGNQLPPLVIGVMFLIFAIGCCIIWIKNIDIINLKYCIYPDKAVNKVGRKTISVDLNGAVYSASIYLPLYIGKGKLVIEYELLSNGTVPTNVKHISNLYKRVRILLKQRCILIPKGAKYRGQFCVNPDEKLR